LLSCLANRSLTGHGQYYIINILILLLVLWFRVSFYIYWLANKW